MPERDAVRDAVVVTDGGQLRWRLGGSGDHDAIQVCLPSGEWVGVFGDNGVSVTPERIRAWGRLLAARPAGGEALTGCCAHCGAKPEISTSPVNDIVNLSVRATCACGPAWFNLWPYPPHPAPSVDRVSEDTKRMDLLEKNGREVAVCTINDVMVWQPGYHFATLRAFLDAARAATPATGETTDG